GTKARATYEPVGMGQHEVEDDEVDRLGGEAAKRLLAVAGGDDAKAVPLERIGEQLLDGVLVVDEEDGRWIWHRGLETRLAKGRPYYSPAWRPSRLSPRATGCGPARSTGP